MKLDSFYVRHWLADKLIQSKCNFTKPLHLVSLEMTQTTIRFVIQ